MADSAHNFSLTDPEMKSSPSPKILTTRRSMQMQPNYLAHIIKPSVTLSICFPKMFNNFANIPSIPKFSDLNITAGEKKKKKKIKGSVVLMRKNVLDFNDLSASAFDTVNELLGQGISVQLVSATKTDQSANGLKGKIGKPAYLENWMFSLIPLAAGDSAFGVSFDWDDQIGVPGAVVVKNNLTSQFFLKSIVLEDVPGVGRMNFVCNSWVYPAKNYKKDGVFFLNKSYLPSDTPVPLATKV
ncbi:hypothetical protein ABKV19_022036 [Rosa sericea]